MATPKLILCILADELDAGNVHVVAAVLKRDIIDSTMLIWDTVEIYRKVNVKFPPRATITVRTVRRAWLR